MNFPCVFAVCLCALVPSGLLRSLPLIALFLWAFLFFATSQPPTPLWVDLGSLAQGHEWRRRVH